ncbi:MAG: N-formylglutamate amidohydrolase [Alphaproteobacteria bacterium]|nr:N-formylglutamate amidohydrolase [Alphaproteobacteria bacterium]
MADQLSYFLDSLQTTIPISERLSLTEAGFCQILHHTVPARVVISVPHDGMIPADFGHFHPRDKGPDGKRAVHGRDKHVWPIVNDILQIAEAANGAVDAVRFLVPRLYIDGNRAAQGSENPDPDTSHQTAFDDDRLLGLYFNYFEVIDHLIARAVKHHGLKNVLFIDCHGFGKQPDIAPPEGFDLILGTDNRKTIRYDEPDRLFAGEMTDLGYQVFLPQEQPTRPQGDPYSAGYTTINTASVIGGNAMQIEIASRFRAAKEDTVRGKKLATDIAGYRQALHFGVRYQPADRHPGASREVDSHLKCNSWRWEENTSAGVLKPRHFLGVELRI